MKSKILLFTFSFLIFPFYSICASYHISLESLIQQLADNPNEKKVNLIIAFPLVFPGIVTGNSLREIHVLDKNDKDVILPVTNRTAIKVIFKDGKDKLFYFDTLVIQDTTITGKFDHFFGVKVKPIPFNMISKIQIYK